ncbi:MAG: hypothetical protein WDM70_01255 [Nitrosomonadales bacterium]
MSLFGQGKPSAASSYHNQFYDIQDNDHSSSNTALPDRLKKAVDYHQAGDWQRQKIFTALFYKRNLSNPMPTTIWVF